MYNIYAFSKSSKFDDLEIKTITWGVGELPENFQPALSYFFLISFKPICVFTSL